MLTKPNLDFRQIENARYFAIGAHAAMAQRRRVAFSGDPVCYSLHPCEVADILLREVSCVDTSTVIAALLHDVLEDTKVSEQTIVDHFGITVKDYVIALTDIDSKAEPALTRKERMAYRRARLALSGSQVQNIKLADIASNCRDIQALWWTTKEGKQLQKPVFNFAELYLSECKELAEVLIKADKNLFAYTKSVLDQASKKLDDAKTLQFSFL